MKKGDNIFIVEGQGYILREYNEMKKMKRKKDGMNVGEV